MKKKKYLLIKIFILILCSIFISLGSNNAFSGQKIKVIDGDSIELNGERIRLEGIDAPEYTQYCFDYKKEKYDCGIKSKEYLEKIVMVEDFYCESMGKDKYNRTLSVCYANGQNVNEAMLAAGWAVVYRSQNPIYNMAQLRAKRQKNGIYRGKYIAPELYRRLNKRKNIKKS